MITVVSLGTERGDLTLRGRAALQSADEVLVRTGKILSAQTLEDEHIPYSTLDFLYEKSRNYDTLAKNIVRELKRRAKGRKVCYCVDGAVNEDSAALLLMQEKDVERVDGRSKGEHFAALANVAGGYTALSAFDLAGKTLTRPLVVYDVTDDNLPDVKLLLAEKFGDEAPACRIDGTFARALPLYEADRAGACGILTGIVLYDEPLLKKEKFTFEDAAEILRRLRAPDGCPWDKVQTHESIRISMIEEAYELVDGIDRQDTDRILEETGDVLMQSLFHAIIEEEKGNFTVTDMVSALCKKLITRHTHVFGEDVAQSADGAVAVWDKNKMKEKGQATFSDAVNDVPECFPALLRAQKIAKRVEKGGWDAATFENFEKKFPEEYSELKAAYASGDSAHILEELGDVLFCAVELGRATGVDCEIALLDTVKKMQARYTAYERLVRADGKDVNALTQEEKDAYYRRAKDASRA